jgi:hypothetical protein
MTMLGFGGHRIVAVEGGRVVRGRALTPVEIQLLDKLEERIWDARGRGNGRDADTLRQALDAWVGRLSV